MICYNIDIIIFVTLKYIVVIKYIIIIFDSDGATAYGRAKYGQSNSSFVLDQVTCVGTESNLGQCPSNPPLLHNCLHGEEAGVMCRGGTYKLTHV
jgi:hypothetical protein